MGRKHVLFDSPLPEGWRVTTVDEIKADEPSSCVAGPFGSNISSKYFVEKGIPVIRGKNLSDDLTKFIPEGFVFVDPERAKVYKAQHVKGNDLVFTCWGTIGQVGLIPDNGPFPEYIISNKQLKLRPNVRIADPLFLFYYFASPQMVAHVRNRAIGAAVPGINLGILKELEVVLPPLETQHKIASILSAYDDLIENNTRRIKVLEEMAQAIYREWFVNFRFPGHEKGKMVDSPLGKVPEGWEVATLESLIAGHIGGGWGKEEPEDKSTEPAWVIRGTDIPGARHCQVKETPYRYHTNSNLKSRRLHSGDVVFEVSGGSKGQPVGRSLFITSQLLSAFGEDPVICASFCKRVQPRREKFRAEILYMSFVEGYSSGEIEQYQVQSTGITNFKWTEYLQQTQRVLPPRKLQEKLCDAVGPLFEQIATIGLKSSNLRQTRDLLLPKLISGEVDASKLAIEIEAG